MGVRRDEAGEVLRELILSGAMPAGADTSETKLLQLLQEHAQRHDGTAMSRTPLREALAVLAHTGMIEQRPQIGLRVRPVSEREIWDILRTRMGLEGIAAELASTRPHDERAGGIQQMKDAVAASQLLVERGMNKADDTQRFSELDTKFHLGLLTAAGLTSAASDLRAYRDRISLFRLGLRPMRAEQADNVMHEHGDIIRWIEDKQDPRGARECAENHLRIAAARLIEVKHLEPQARADLPAS